MKAGWTWNYVTSGDVQEHVFKAYTSRIPSGDAKSDLSH
jgi:hypothetical protein